MIKINLKNKLRLHFLFDIYYINEWSGDSVNEYISNIFNNNILMKALYG